MYLHSAAIRLSRVRWVDYGHPSSPLLFFLLFSFFFFLVQMSRLGVFVVQALHLLTSAQSDLHFVYEGLTRLSSSWRLISTPYAALLRCMYTPCIPVTPTHPLEKRRSLSATFSHEEFLFFQDESGRYKKSGEGEASKSPGGGNDAADSPESWAVEDERELERKERTSLRFRKELSFSLATGWPTASIVVSLLLLFEPI